MTLRRLLPLCLALVMLCGAALAQPVGNDTEEARIAHLTALVDHYLTTQGYRFSYRENPHSFTFEVPADNTLPPSSVTINLSADLLMVSAFPSIFAAEENRVKMAKLITLINWDSSWAHLYMDMDTGQIISSADILTLSVYPGEEELHICVGMVGLLLETYGNAIVRVALLGEDPQAIFDAVPRPE